MLYHRPKACLALLGLAAVALHSSCSTKAVGVEECRDIEYARCRAATHCPAQFDVTDVEQCRLYYRDHCLHGMALASPPNAANVKLCIEKIEILSDCAEVAHASDPDVDPDILSCSDVESLRPKITTVCKLLATPEAIPDCAFLVSDAATGGQSGTGGQTGSGGTTSGGTSATSSGEGGIIDLLGLGGLFQ